MIDELKKYISYTSVVSISVDNDEMRPMMFSGNKLPRFFTISIEFVNGKNIQLPPLRDYEVHQHVMDTIIANDLQLSRRLKINKIVNK